MHAAPLCAKAAPVAHLGKTLAARQRQKRDSSACIDDVRSPSKAVSRPPLPRFRSNTERGRRVRGVQPNLVPCPRNFGAARSGRSRSSRFQAGGDAGSHRRHSAISLRLGPRSGGDLLGTGVSIQLSNGATHRATTKVLADTPSCTLSRTGEATGQFFTDSHWSTSYRRSDC